LAVALTVMVASFRDSVTQWLDRQAWQISAQRQQFERG
jgi:hypothetical protein